MPTSPGVPEAWRMTSDGLDRMFALVREVGRAELKFVVAESSHDAVRAALGGGPTRVRRVYFLDTADLALRRHGVLARVRGGQQPNDSVVKLRPIAPDDLPAGVRCSEEFSIEVDLTPDDFVCSGALKRRLGRHAVERAVAGERQLGTLFSEEQVALFADWVAPEDLRAWGPVHVRRTRPRRDEAGHGLELQQWKYPDGSRLLELSTRCAAENLIPSAVRATAFLRQHGIALAGPCPTKADATLAYFTRRRSPVWSGAGAD